MGARFTEGARQPAGGSRKGCRSLWRLDVVGRPGDTPRDSRSWRPPHSSPLSLTKAAKDPTPPRAMELTAEELYKFDCQGHFTVRSALSPTELAACRAAVAAASSATDLPLPAAVERYAAAVLQGILTQDQRLDHNKAGAFPDTPLHIVSSGSTDVASDLGAQGDVLERDRLGYERHRMWSACRGMRVFIATTLPSCRRPARSRCRACCSRCRCRRGICACWRPQPSTAWSRRRAPRSYSAR